MKNYTVYFTYTVGGVLCFGNLTIKAEHAGQAEMIAQESAAYFQNFKIMSVR